MYSLFSSIVYLTLDTFYKVGKPFILLVTHAMFTDMVWGWGVAVMAVAHRQSVSDNENPFWMNLTLHNYGQI